VEQIQRSQKRHGGFQATVWTHCSKILPQSVFPLWPTFLRQVSHRDWTVRMSLCMFTVTKSKTFTFIWIATEAEFSSNPDMPCHSPRGAECEDRCVTALIRRSLLCLLITSVFIMMMMFL
jgi:hypothetical protein